MRRLKTSLRTLLSIAIIGVLACSLVPVMPPKATSAASGGKLTIKVEPVGLAAADANALLTINGAENFSDYGTCNTILTPPDASKGVMKAGSVALPITAEGVTCEGINFHSWLYSVPGYQVNYLPFLRAYHQTIEHETYDMSYTLGSENYAKVHYCSLGSCGFTSGTDDIRLTLKITPYKMPLSVLPKMSATSVTTDSVTLKWNDLYNSEGNRTVFHWFIYQDDGKRVSSLGRWPGVEKSIGELPASQHTYKATGLSPCTTYRFGLQMHQQWQGTPPYVYANGIAYNNRLSGTDILNYVKVRTTGCVTRTTNSSDNSSTSPAPAQPSRSTRQASITGSGLLDAFSKKNKNTAPTMPNYITATGDKGSSTVHLAWGDSSSETPVYYLIERSQNDKTWQKLSATITNNFYDDYDTDFATRYSYRVTAINELGKKSASTTVSITTNKFDANLTARQSLSLKSNDKTLQVTIPTHAVKDEANCSIVVATDLPLNVAGDKQRIVGDPYRLVCQYSDGSLVKQFQKPLSVTVTLPEKAVKSHHDFQFKTYDTKRNEWVTTPVKQNGKNTYQLTSDNIALVAVGVPNTTPWWIVAGYVVGIAAATLFTAIQIARYSQRVVLRKRALAIEESYWRQEHGL